MGSGQSKPPQQTQSAPATARTTPKPRRNQQFQEVQINPTGGNPKPRQTGRTQGSSPNPHQATNSQARSGQRGQDPGASGAQSDRSNRQQQQQRQGAAATGRSRQTEMRGSQQQQTKTGEIKKGDNPEHVDGTQAANGSSPGTNNPGGNVQQMVNDLEKSQKGPQKKNHVTGKAENKPGKQKNTVIQVKPGKPVETNKKVSLIDKKGSDAGKHTKTAEINGENDTNTSTGMQNGNKAGIIKKSKIFRPGLKGIDEDNEDETSKQANVGQKSGKTETNKSKVTGKKVELKQGKNDTQKLDTNKEGQNDDSHDISDTKPMVAKEVNSQKKEQAETTEKDKEKDKHEIKKQTMDKQHIDQDNSKPDHQNKLSNKEKQTKEISKSSQVKELSEGTKVDAENDTKKDKEEADKLKIKEETKSSEIDHGKVKHEGKENIETNDANTEAQSGQMVQGTGQPDVNKDMKSNAKVTTSQTVREQNIATTGSKLLMDKEGNLNLAALDRVADQIQKLQEDKAEDTLSQLSYDKEFGDDEEASDIASHLSHDLDSGGHGSEVGASHEDAEVLSMKDDDIVFETFYHRSGKEFQCIYQSGMRFYLDDWGSKEWQPFPKRWYNEGLLVTNTILREDGTEQTRTDQSGASGQGQSRSSQSRSQGQGGGGGGGGNDDREGFINHPTRGKIPTYIFYKKHNVHMYFDKSTGAWVRLPIGWELHHEMVKNLVDQVEEAVPTWGDRHDILALLRACNYDPDECISIYLHLEKDVWMKAPRTSKEAKGEQDKENRIAELEMKVRDLEIQLQKERTQREELERNLDEQTNKMSEIEAESKQTEAQMSAMTGGRPKSARPISVMMLAGKGKGAKGGGKPTKAGEVVNPDDVLDLNANAKELRKAHTKLKMEVERYFGDFKHIVMQVGPAIKQMKQSEKGTQAEIEEVRALYRKEALQRRLLYNQLQELRGNIRVFCRVRKDDRADNCLKYPSDQDIMAVHPQNGKKMFNFDKVFEPSSTQEQVFEDTKPIITSCADGYNVCLLAYGQTGSGKTFTMMGPESNPGINIRAMKELFQVCKDRAETMSYKLTVSLVEIYNETLQDLLTSDAKTLELRTAGNKVNIPGLTEHVIKNVDDVKKIMSMGDKNRSVASTKMNSTSSRSHLVLMLAVEGVDKVTNAVTRGTLVLCDLAGSERIAKTEAEGQRLVEAAAINKSLSALGQVFTALRTSQLHVPYRNSKLTQILQPSLGGDAKACLFVNVSPDLYNHLETVSTLTFGSNARQVALGQAKQNISKGKG